MNKTFNVNLGGLPFQIDEDAYSKLNAYLDAVRAKFIDVEGHQDIIDDIEARLAEMFQEGLDKTGRRIVALKDVDAAITVMGRPEEFGFDDEGSAESNTASSTTTTTRNTRKKWFRDPDDAVVGGVLSGLAKYFGIEDPIWLRVGVAVLPFADFLFLGISTTSIIITYIILWAVLPKADTKMDKMRMRGEPINLETITKNAEDLKKNLSSEKASRAGTGIRDIFRWIFKAIAFFFLGIGLIIVGSILLSLLAALVAGAGSLLVASPFISAHIFGSAWMSWVSVIGLILLLGAPLIFLVLLLLKLLFKTKTNMPVIAFSSLGAFILGLVFTGITFGNFGRDMVAGATVEEKQPISLAEGTMLLAASKEGFDIEEETGKKVRFDFNAKKGAEANIRIVKARDSIAYVTKKLHARGKSNNIAKNRAEAISYEVDVNGNTLEVPRNFVLGDDELWRAQHVELNVELPVGQRFEVDESTKYMITSVKKAPGYGGMTVYDGVWEMTADGIVKLDANGNPVEPEIKQEEEKERRQNSDDWDSFDEWRESGKVDDSETITLDLFGKKLLNITVDERNGDGDAERVRIQLGNDEVLDLQIEEDGETVTINGERRENVN